MDSSEEAKPARIRASSIDERRAVRRTRLIAAAADVYGEVGYRGATVRMICRRAQLTERYFYESFDSSEKLLVEAAAMLANRTFAHLKAVRDASTAPPPETMLRVLEEYFRVLSREASKARVFTLEIRGLGGEADAELERILDAFGWLIVDIGDPERSGPAAGDRLLRRGIVGGVLQIALAWIERGFAEPLASVVRASATLCAVATSEVPARTKSRAT